MFFDMNLKTILGNVFLNFPSWGDRNTNIADKICAFLLATAPLLQHYKGFIVNAGIIVLILCIPYICLKLLFRFRELNLKNVIYALPLVLFEIFCIIDHGTSFLELAHGVVLCVYFIAVSLGGINLRYVTVSAYLIAMVASICILIQTISYYFFGYHLQFVITGLLLDESSDWIALAQTGTIGVNGVASAIYRPSAFFLEPSHMLLYFMPVLFLVLLSPKMNRVKRISAVILSLGLVCSTSGMGIALVFGAWLLQLGFSNGKENQLRVKNIFQKKNIIHCAIFILVFGIACLILPFIRYSILRIFLGNAVVTAMVAGDAPMNVLDGSEHLVQDGAADMVDSEPNPGSTAISGRTERASSLIRVLHGSELMIGVADAPPADISFNLPGFFATMYKYGIIGTIISYVFYVLSVIFTKSYSRWTAVIILVISMFSAHTHGTFYMLFYVLFLMGGWMPKKND